MVQETIDSQVIERFIVLDRPLREKKGEARWIRKVGRQGGLRPPPWKENRPVAQARSEWLATYDSLPFYQRTRKCGRRAIGGPSRSLSEAFRHAVLPFVGGVKRRLCSSRCSPLKRNAGAVSSLLCFKLGSKFHLFLASYRRPRLRSALRHHLFTCPSNHHFRPSSTPPAPPSPPAGPGRTTKPAVLATSRGTQMLSRRCGALLMPTTSLSRHRLAQR